MGTIITTGPAMSTEIQSVFRAIAPVPGHRMATAITLHVHITNSKVLATNTGSTSVVLEVAVVGSDQVITVTTPHVLLTLTSVLAIGIENY